MNIKKLIVSFSAAAMLLPLFSCSEKNGVKNGFDIIPPEINDADSVEITLPIGGNHVTLDDIDEKFGKKLCKAAGTEFTEDGLNSIWFGENIFGVGLASVVYLGKAVTKINDEQWELLIRIAEEPDKYSSVFGSEDADSPDPLINSHVYFTSRIPDSAYFDAMIEEIVKDYSKKYNCSRNEAFEFLYTDGITINTPYSSDIQGRVDDVYSDASSFCDDTEILFPQSACAVLDYSGGVTAAAGGNGGSKAYNRFYRIPHKVGSSIKPISVYAPTLEEGIINFSSRVPDIPLELQNNNETFIWPQNYDGLYEGDITVTAALRKSKNTVAVFLEEALGSLYCLSYLRDNLKFTSLTDNDASPSALAMGALDKGMYMHELAAAYAVFGNGGNYYEPRFYDTVMDHDGNIILEKTSETHRALKEENAWIMNRLLYYNISTTDGIAKAAALDDGTEVIGKTGTVTNSNTEDSGKLFAGGTPQYVAAVWEGFDDEESTIDINQYHTATLIWKAVMEKLPHDTELFTPSENVIEQPFCVVTGDIAVNKCGDAETGYYTEDNMPPVCSGH